MQAHGTLEFSGGGGLPGPGTVTNTMLAPQAANTVVANATGGAASPTAVPLDATLAFSGGSLTRAAISGDVTIAAGSNTSAIGANKVTNAMLAQAAANTLKGNATGALANETDITLGAGLAFTGGQLALAATGGPYVLKAGDTMTGALVVNNASTAGVTIGPGGTGSISSLYYSVSLGSGGGFGGIRFTANSVQKGLIYYNQPTDTIIIASSGLDPAVRIAPDGGLIVGSSGASLGAGSIYASGPIRTGIYTVATLPSAAAIDAQRAFVTDALGPTFGATVVGGGSIPTPVYCYANAWKVG